jgi:hypothetical protein
VRKRASDCWHALDHLTDAGCILPPHRRRSACSRGRTRDVLHGLFICGVSVGRAHLPSALAFPLAASIWTADAAPSSAHPPACRTVFSLIVALLFCGYIVFDTYMLMERYSLDEYVWASVALYLVSGRMINLPAILTDWISAKLPFFRLDGSKKQELAFENLLPGLPRSVLSWPLRRLCIP